MKYYIIDLYKQFLRQIIREQFTLYVCICLSCLKTHYYNNNTTNWILQNAVVGKKIDFDTFNDNFFNRKLKLL